MYVYIYIYIYSIYVLYTYTDVSLLNHPWYSDVFYLGQFGSISIISFNTVCVCLRVIYFYIYLHLD